MTSPDRTKLLGSKRDWSLGETCAPATAKRPWWVRFAGALRAVRRPRLWALPGGASGFDVGGRSLRKLVTDRRAAPPCLCAATSPKGVRAWCDVADLSEANRSGHCPLYPEVVESPRATPQSVTRPSAVDVPPLHPEQLTRITSLHRGFLYQHLFAVACLLRLGVHGARELLVERDEDVELVLTDHHLYVQVKTRQAPLGWADIRGAVDAFDRGEHTSGRRQRQAELVVVSNVPPGPALLGRMRSDSWPQDVSVQWPSVPDPDDRLPPSWPDLAAALEWCTAEVRNVPFSSLQPESLGSPGRPRHRIRESGGVAAPGPGRTGVGAPDPGGSRVPRRNRGSAGRTSSTG